MKITEINPKKKTIVYGDVAKGDIFKAMDGKLYLKFGPQYAQELGTTKDSVFFSAGSFIDSIAKEVTIKF